jgi:hypothetical protein
MEAVFADLVAVVHGAFVAFVALGGIIAWRFPRLIWLHLPALAWGIWIVTFHECPLTDLENGLRRAAGEPGYEGGFIEHYITPLFSGLGLTRAGQFWLNVTLLGLNVAAYAALLVLFVRQKKQTKPTAPPP